VDLVAGSEVLSLEEYRNIASWSEQKIAMDQARWLAGPIISKTKHPFSSATHVWQFLK
jgi:hypothetical protein